MTDRRCLRIVFDGHSARETIICNLVEETGEKINILAANTKSVAGQGFGQMIIELPDRKEGGERFLNTSGNTEYTPRKSERRRTWFR